MSINNINRQLITRNVSSAYTAQLDDDQIIGDCTSAGFTVTLYKVNDGAVHRLIVAVSPSDSSGNTLTITDGTFSTTLTAASAAVTIETQYDGTWMIAGEYPVTSSSTATSSATSAGAAASVAASEAGSAGSKATQALSAATSGTTLATSEATSGGSAAAVALSAASSGTTLATSEATSGGLAASTSLSAAVSAGAAASVALSVAKS